MASYKKASDERARGALRQAPRNRYGQPCCHYCGEILWGDRTLPGRAYSHVGNWSVDHKDPRNLGSNDLSNLVVACVDCNAKKGSTPYQQFVYENAINPPRNSSVHGKTLDGKWQQALPPDSRGPPSPAPLPQPRYTVRTGHADSSDDEVEVNTWHRPSGYGPRVPNVGHRAVPVSSGARLQQAQQRTEEPESSGMGLGGWLGVAAGVVGIGALIFGAAAAGSETDEEERRRRRQL